MGRSENNTSHRFNTLVHCNCGCEEVVTRRTRLRHLKQLDEETGDEESEGEAPEGTLIGNLPGISQDGHLSAASSPMNAPTDDLTVDLDGVNEPEAHLEGQRSPEMGDIYAELVLEARSETPTSPGSWYNIGTPLPSPPRSPLACSDDESSEDEDGYIGVNSKDYREYDRWYAEDCQAELDEIRGDILGDEEMDSIKMMAIRMFGHISQRNYERIRFSFREKIHLLTLQRLHTCVSKLSGVSPHTVHCCIKSCHAFTGDKSDLTHCALCGQARYDDRGRPRQVFEYLPITPRLQAMFNNPELVQRMLYRHNYVQHDGIIEDIFDSTLYKDLCARNIIVDGTDTGRQFFSGNNDIATSFLTDGVQLFEQASEQNSSCWPLMLQNLNLPPSERVQLRNLIPFGVIPGPNQPHDFDSFLVPFVAECLTLARGVPTFNALTGKMFTLRMHPLIVCGDMQAIKHLEQLKGPNVRVPCRSCRVVGFYHAARRTYYVPLVVPKNQPNELQSYDPRNLPLRTEDNMVRQLALIEGARNKTGRDDLTKKYGISGRSLLDQIPSIQRPTSYPHEFMHLFLLNHGAELVSLWTNSCSGISDTGSGDYLISDSDWTAIGHETEAATNLIPAALIRPLPNIKTCLNLYCAESWSFWLIYVGPIVLRGRLGQKYYKHYLELVAILRCLLELSNTVQRLEDLREDIAQYVERFEEYYYQYDYERLCVCKLTLHALLHVAEETIRCGPVWVSWSFAIERYCREITFCTMSKVVPYSTINKHVLQMAQLSAVSSKFPEIRKALLFGKGDNPVTTSRMEHIYPGYPTIILRFPCLRQFLIPPNVRRRIAAFFHTNNPQQTFHQWLEFIPERCERWGKIRISNGGDCIRSASACNPLSPYGKRDSSYVRYIHSKDKNENYRNRPVELVYEAGYGRLDSVLALELPADDRFQRPEPQLFVLAHITECQGATGDATSALISYRQMGRSFVLDVRAIENVVGRVKTTGVVQSGEWIIVDRSSSACRTVFHCTEDRDRDLEDDT